MHALQNIAQTGATPAGSDKAQEQERAKRIATRDDKMAGNMLANEAIALAMQQANDWRNLFFRPFDLTLEGRTYFLDAVKNWRKEQAAANVTGTGADAKVIKRRMAAALTRISELTTVANAINAGASMAGYVDYIIRTHPECKGCTEEDARKLVGIAVLVEYARTFSEAKAGRKADTWLVKMGKFLERNKPAEDDKVGNDQFAKFVALYNELTEQ